MIRAIHLICFILLLNACASHSQPYKGELIVDTNIATEIPKEAALSYLNRTVATRIQYKGVWKDVWACVFSNDSVVLHKTVGFKTLNYNYKYTSVITKAYEYGNYTYLWVLSQETDEIGCLIISMPKDSALIRNEFKKSVTALSSLGVAIQQEKTIK